MAKKINDLLRPKRSLTKAARMAPKKAPAVSKLTTLAETRAFLGLVKPDLSIGRPKSSLKLDNARTLPITPVS